MFRFLLAVFLMFAAPLTAQTPMTAEEFDAYTQGKTFYYGEGGQSYGVEEYFPDRRVRWSFLDGKCVDGSWYVARDLICFVYENNPDPQCWSFFLEGGRLLARFENDPAATELYETRNSPKPMLCYGPDVGA